MKTLEDFKNVEKNLRRCKISGFLPSQNFTFIAGEIFANVLFHTYTNADKAIIALKDLGFKVKGNREKNPSNAYFKYFVTIH